MSAQDKSPPLSDLPPVIAVRPSAQDTSGSRGARRVLTALCYDIVGSTELLQIMDIEDFEDLMSAFRQAARRAVELNSGNVWSESGDGGLALFPIDADAKDAATLAIASALEIVAGCKRVGRELNRQDLQVRVGVATSMFLVSEGEAVPSASKLTGPALALATRLQAIAAPDTVLVSHETRQLAGRSFDFASEGPRTLKGFATPQQVWRAVRRRRQVDRFFAFGRVTGPLVNRAAEIKAMAECWERAVAGFGGIVLIEGEAGIGKSRLVHEIRQRTRARRAELLLLQCLPGGARTALHPMVQGLLRDAGGGMQTVSAAEVSRQFREYGVTDEQAIDVFSFLLGVPGTGKDLAGADPQAIRERSFWALRRAVEQMCGAGPVAAVLEDIQWGDFTTRQLLTEFAGFVSRLPVLLVVTSRGSDVIDWPDPGAVTVLKVGPLTRDDTQNAILSKLKPGAAGEGHKLVGLIERVSGGVPLFIEEICQWASENAQQMHDQLAGEKPSFDQSAFGKIIEARLARLGPLAELARAASVAMHRFGARMLAALLPDATAAFIGNGLEELSKAGLITELRQTEPPLYSFRHALIQEAIYKSMLRAPKRLFHQRLFEALRHDPAIAPWTATAALAEHAERAGLIEDAIVEFTRAGQESANRSAAAEARQVLEHALSLCDQAHIPARRDELMLHAMAILGPVLTASEGPSSAPARKLYEDGVTIARRRPQKERARWFPIYWGWWFTGADVNGERAHALLKDLKDVDDPEVQLQARHCVWAIDFYLGKHGNCITQVNEALPLYGVETDKARRTLFGGHDAKVCGLAHRGLSLWFAGKVAEAAQSVAEAKALARDSGHIGSIAHALNNSAMLACYRRDVATLRREIAGIRALTVKHRLPTLEATALILEGWCDGMEGRAGAGCQKMRAGLATHKELQTPEDYPVYCCMLAELLAKLGEEDVGLRLLNSAAETAEQSGHLYWLSEVHRRRARLILSSGGARADAANALAQSLAIATEQGAMPLLLSAYDDAARTGLSPALVAQYADAVEAARAAIGGGIPFHVSPEPSLEALP